MLTVVTLSLALLAGGAPAAPVSAQAPAIDAPLVLPVSIGDIGALAFCSATADCGTEYADVYCEDNTDPAECTAVDTDCSTGTIGYVECDGFRTSCPSDSCEVECTDGDTRTVATGLCCVKDPCGGESIRYEKCVDGAWQLDRTQCEATINCPASPC